MDWQQTRESLLRSGDVQHLIAERAYLISQSRGFQDGHEIEDWFQAEHDVLADLQREYEARHAEVPAANALALTDSAIFEEPVASPIASSAISVESGETPIEKEKKAPAKKKATAKRAPKTETTKAKSASTKTRESKAVKTTTAKSKPILKKASKKPTSTSPSSEAGD